MIKFRRIRSVKIAVVFFSVFLMSYLIFSSNNSVYLSDEFAGDFKSHDSVERQLHDGEMDEDPAVPRNRVQQRTIPEIPVSKKLSQLLSTSPLGQTPAVATKNLSTTQIFSPNITKSRIDSLFRILSEKEEKYGDILDQLDLISFKNLAKSKTSRQSSDAKLPANYKYELDNYLDVEGERIVSSEKFVENLWQKSVHYSFTNRRESVTKSAINDVSLPTNNS